MLTRLSRNAATLLVSNLGTAILAFALSIVIGRGLGDTGLGQYATVMAWILPLTLIADFGVSTLLTRDIAQRRGLTLPYIQAGLRLRWCLAGGLVAVVWLLAPYLASDDLIVDGLRLAAPLILIDSTFGIYTAVWRAWETMLPILWLNLGLLTVQVLGAMAAIKLDMGLRGVLVAVVVADGLQLCATWLLWRIRYRTEIHETAIDAIAAKAMFNAASQFMLGGALAAIQARMMFLLLEHYSSAQVVGWFAAASRFIEAAKMPPFALFGAAFPALSALLDQPDHFKQTFRRMTAILAAYALLVALLFSVIGAFVIKLTFGGDFKNAAPILMWLSWGLLPALLRQNLTVLYYARHQEKQINLIMLATLPIQAALAISLIQSDGARGAAIALLGVESLMLGLLWLRTRRAVLFTLALVVLIGLLGRLEIRHKVAFDGLYGQDAFAYYDYGVEVKHAVHDLRVPDPMYWPLGLPIVLGVAFRLFGESAQVGQWAALSMGGLAGGAAFLLIYDLLRLIRWSRQEALIAGITTGLLLAGCGQLVQSSLVVMADAPAVLWSTLSAWCLVRWALSQPYKEYFGRVADPPLQVRRAYFWLGASSLTLAFASITRWHYLLLIPVWGLFCWRQWGWRLRWREIGLAGVLASLILIPQYLHSRLNPVSFADHQWLQGWNLSNATGRDFVNPDGTFHYKKTVLEFYASAAWEGYYLHHLFLPLILVGCAVLIWQFRRSQAALILLIGWAAFTYGFLIGIPYENVRFSLAFFVPLAGMAGIGMAVLSRLLNRLPVLGWSAQGALILAALLAVNTTYEAGQHQIEQFARIKNADLAAVEWAKATIPEQDAEVYSLGLWLMMQHYAPTLDARQLFYETPETLAERLKGHQPTYLFLNLWDIDHQWVGKPLWVTYHWLEDQYGLTPIGRYGNYHLLKVNGT